jgi:pectate lyase
MLSDNSTTGGAGGTTTTVSSYAAFSAAAKGDAKKIIIVDGSISGTGSVKIGANTSVLGKAGACTTSQELQRSARDLLTSHDDSHHRHQPEHQGGQECHRP